MGSVSDDRPGSLGSTVLSKVCTLVSCALVGTVFVFAAFVRVRGVGSSTAAHRASLCCPHPESHS